MYKASDSFIAAMKDHPYIAKITLDGADVIQGEVIQEIIFRGGANGDENTFTLGSTVSASIEVTLTKAKIDRALHGREVKVDLGIELSGTQEWIPMGVYYVTDPLADDDRLTVKAYDAFAAKFDVEYEALAGFDFEADVGVSSTAFLQALGARRGVEVDISNITPILLTASPDGFTERQIVGFIAALYGGFASIDRTGVLRIHKYSECDVSVTADEYYEGGMEKADYAFSVQWLKCYNEIYDMTMIVGDTAGEQGIYLESIWMTNTILNDLWGQLQGFSYQPVPELSFLGNPLIDAGDIISFEDVAGEIIKVPVMNVTHEYDGGIITRIVASGQAKTDGHASSLRRDIKRTGDNAKRYTDRLNEALDQLEVLKRLTAAGTDDAIFLQNGKLAIKATAILTGVLDAAIVTVKNLVADCIVSGALRSSDRTTYFDLDNAEIVAQDHSGQSVALKWGQVFLRDKSGKTRASIRGLSGGGYIISVRDSDGADAGGMAVIDDKLQLFGPKEDGSGVVGKPVCWRNVHVYDESGNYSSATVLASL